MNRKTYNQIISLIEQDREEIKETRQALSDIRAKQGCTSFTEDQMLQIKLMNLYSQLELHLDMYDDLFNK